MYDKILGPVIDAAIAMFGIPAFFRDYMFVAAYAVFAFVLFVAYVYVTVYAERKLMARSHSRYGPVKPGPFGIFVLAADMIKLLSKEDTVPDGASPVIFRWSPAFLAMITVLVIMLLPLGRFYIADQTFSLIVPIAFLALVPMIILLAGWSSNSKYPYMGALRNAALLMSYEVVLILSVVGIVILTGSFNIVDISLIQQNGVWFVLLQPIGFALFMMSAIAAAERLPFDMPFADNELVAGWKTEYSGVRYLLTIMTEYGIMLATSVVSVFLFFGGWAGPTSLAGFAIPSEVWLFFKVALIIFFYIWLRATFPRLRIDQLLGMAWEYMIPLAVVNLAIAIAVRILWM